MEHDPLRDSDNALLRLVQSGEFRLDSIVRIRHGRAMFLARKDETNNHAAYQSENRDLKESFLVVC